MRSYRCDVLAPALVVRTVHVTRSVVVIARCVVLDAVLATAAKVFTAGLYAIPLMDVGVEGTVVDAIHSYPL
jgi:hypothetical protein